MFFKILEFLFFFLAVRFRVLQTFAARHIPSLPRQFVFFFCVTASAELRLFSSPSCGFSVFEL
jgi:hypothetical protein